MSRIHDMGGRFGDGSIIPEDEDAPKFAEAWHSRALAVTLACASLGKWNIDVSRHARESLAPGDYARFSYYEKWLGGLADMLVETCVLTRAELREGRGHGPSALAARTLRQTDVAGVLAKGGPANRPSAVAPIFKVGDAVLTRKAANTLVAGGHTRLPTYAAGTPGRVMLYHGTHVLPDKSAHGLGDGAEPLYAVAMRAGDVWAHPEHPDDEVVLDLWQSYLEQA